MGWEVQEPSSEILTPVATSSQTRSEDHWSWAARIRWTVSSTEVAGQGWWLGGGWISSPVLRGWVKTSPPAP